MAGKTEQIQKLIAPVVVAMGFELFGLEYLAHGTSATLRIYIDSPNGVNLDDCAKVSDQLSAVLDVENPIAEKYSLEVSSPGIERPLFLLAHYERYIGKKVAIKVFAPIEGQRNFSGTIKTVEDCNVVLVLEDEKIVSIPFDSITKGHLRGNDYE